MKLNRVLIFLLLIVFSVSVLAQENEDLSEYRSETKVTISGKPYYVHIVSKGETLTRISKIYSVPVDVIISENPPAYNGLSIGMVLKVPLVEDVEAKLKKEGKKYHIVKPKETLFSLSKLYNVSTTDIKKANNLRTNELSIDQVVVIPELVDKYDEDYIYHIIRPGESLSDLKKKYGVREKVIKRLNKDKFKEGYRAGIEVIIPLNPDVDKEGMEPKVEIVEVVEVAPVTNTVDYSDCFEKVQFNRSQHYKVVAFLPLYLDRNFPGEGADGMIKHQYRKRGNSKRIFKKSKNFVSFYKGMLIAVDRLKHQGLNLELLVFDTANDTLQVERLLTENNFSDVSLFIGPVFPECFSKVAEYAGQRRINIVSPLGQLKNGSVNNPYVYQVIPSMKEAANNFISVLKEINGVNKFVVYNGDEKDNTEFDVTPYLSELYEMDDSTVTEFVYTNDMKEETDSVHPLESMLKRDIENIIILPSGKKGFVSEVVQKLDTYNKLGYDIKVVGPSSWRRQDALNVEMLYNLEYRTSSPFYVDYEDDKVKDFIAFYRELYSSEPDMFSFQGYDVGTFFLTALFNYGYDFKFCLNQFHPELLQNRIYFDSSTFDTINVNKGSFYLKYNKDFSVEVR
jgi:LysM repeat protein/ABC-type branched-subunit amino acid transport system substrate-binding protein